MKIIQEVILSLILFFIFCTGFTFLLCEFYTVEFTWGYIVPVGSLVLGFVALNIGLKNEDKTGEIK